MHINYCIIIVHKYQEILCFVSPYVLQQRGNIFIKLITQCKVCYKYLIHTALAIYRKLKLIYIVTQSHIQLKEDEITVELLVRDSSKPNLKNFSGKRHATNAWKKKTTKNYAKKT